MRKRKNWLRRMMHGALWGLLALLGTLLLFRYYGLPEQIGRSLKEELDRRGLEVQFSRLYLDPMLRVVARDVEVEYAASGALNRCRINRLRFDFNWVSWWRGETLLERVLVSGAEVTIPLDSGTEIRLENVGAEVAVRPWGSEVRRFQARVLNFVVTLKGSLRTQGYAPRPGKPDTPEARAARARAWRSVTEACGKFEDGSPVRVHLEFDLAPAEWEKGAARLQFLGRRQIWSGVVCEELSLQADFQDGLLMADLAARGLRGGVQAKGTWRVGEPSAALAFYSDVDLTLLAPALPGNVGAFLKDVRFGALPQNEGEIDLAWAEGLRYHLRARSTWENFTIRDARIDRFYAPVAYDGKRMIVSQMELQSPKGGLTLDYYYDGESDLRGRLRSDVDPTVFKALFGEAAQPFFDSLEFRSKGPEIDCRISGTAPRPEVLRLEGRLVGGDCLYKGVELTRVETSFAFENFQLHLPDLKLARPEGEGGGDVWHDLGTKMVRLKGVKTRLNLRELARILGGKMEEYAAPYRFFEAPACTAEGVVDVARQVETDLKATVQSRKGMEYEFLKKTVVLSDLDADLAIRGKRLEVRPRKAVGLFGGTLRGTLDVNMVEDAEYTAEARLDNNDFGRLMKTYFGNEDVTGTMDAELKVRGRFSDMKTIKGTGQLTVSNGVLYPIPILGSFSEVLNSIIPNLGYSTADKALATYDLEGGVIHIAKLDVYSTAFALIGGGEYDYLRDAVNLDMRVNVRGIAGIMFFPLSKLFEYRGTGTMEETIWEPKSF